MDAEVLVGLILAYIWAAVQLFWITDKDVNRKWYGAGLFLLLLHLPGTDYIGHGFSYFGLIWNGGLPLSTLLVLGVGLIVIQCVLHRVNNKYADLVLGYIAWAPWSLMSEVWLRVSFTEMLMQCDVVAMGLMVFTIFLLSKGWWRTASALCIVPLGYLMRMVTMASMMSGRIVIGFFFWRLGIYNIELWITILMTVGVLVYPLFMKIPLQKSKEREKSKPMELLMFMGSAAIMGVILFYNSADFLSSSWKW